MQFDELYEMVMVEPELRRPRHGGPRVRVGRPHKLSPRCRFFIFLCQMHWGNESSANSMLCGMSDAVLSEDFDHCLSTLLSHYDRCEPGGFGAARQHGSTAAVPTPPCACCPPLRLRQAAASEPGPLRLQLSWPAAAAALAGNWQPAWQPAAVPLMVARCASCLLSY